MRKKKLWRDKTLTVTRRSALVRRFFFFFGARAFFSPTRQSANDDKYDDNDDKDDANNNNDNNATIMKPRKPNTNTKEHKQCGTWSPLALEFARNRRKHAKRPF
jgi:hypothetical protein